MIQCSDRIMDAQQAFTQFVQRCLSAEKARRFSELAGSKKGQRKLLAGFYHEFEPAVLAKAVRGGGYDKVSERPCFVFHESFGFGVEFASVREA